MELRNKKIILASSIVATLVLFVSVAFAALASNLNISFGNVTQNALVWNVGFKGSSVIPTTDGTSDTGLSCGSATVTPSTITISDSTLSKPGDKCTYPLTIQNSGDIAAELSNIAATAPQNTNCEINGSTMLCGNIIYKLTTLSDTTLSTGITINSEEEYNIQLVVSFSGDKLNSSAVTQSNAKFTLTYSQANERSEEAAEGIESSDDNPNAVCKRAKKLHTDQCAYDVSGYSEDDLMFMGDSLGCYSAGYSLSGRKGTTTITYGNLGTKGTLTSGDAFDCDVNGDGTYDHETERFYYVSGLDGDNESLYATLIYYTNVSAGVPNSTATFRYHSASNNNTGPTIAYQQLPTTEQWSNVSLSNQKRQIYSQTGTTSTSAGSLPQFTYSGRAARLLSHKEVNAGCGITIGSFNTGELDNCEYLLEHTLFSTSNSNVNAGWWWLESPKASSSSDVFNIHGYLRSIYDFGANNSGGFTVAVRPAIEVLKTDIDY